nr:hypothetical protein [Pandoravirus aubagnensis]
MTTTTRPLLQLDDTDDHDARDVDIGAFFAPRHGAPAAYDAFAALDPLDDDYDADGKGHAGHSIDDDHSGGGDDAGGTVRNNNHNGQQHVKHARAFEDRGDRRPSGAARVLGQQQRHEDHDPFARLYNGGGGGGDGDDDDDDGTDDASGSQSTNRKERSSSCFGVAPSARTGRRAMNSSDRTGSANAQDENALFGQHHHHHHQQQHYQRGRHQRNHHHHHDNHHHVDEPRHEPPTFTAPFLASPARASSCPSQGSPVPHTTVATASHATDHEFDLRDARRAYVEATEELAERQRAYEIEREETIKKMDARHKLSVLPLHEAAAAAQDRMRAAAGALQRQFDRRVVELEADNTLGHEARAVQLASIERARMAALHPNDAYGHRERAATAAAMDSVMSMVDSLFGGRDGVFLRGPAAPFVRVVPLQPVAPSRQRAHNRQVPSPQRHTPQSAVRIEEID